MFAKHPLVPVVLNTLLLFNLFRKRFRNFVTVVRMSASSVYEVGPMLKEAVQTRGGFLSSCFVNGTVSTAGAAALDRSNIRDTPGVLKKVTFTVLWLSRKLQTLKKTEIQGFSREKMPFALAGVREELMVHVDDMHVLNFMDRHNELKSSYFKNVCRQVSEDEIICINTKERILPVGCAITAYGHVRLDHGQFSLKAPWHTGGIIASTGDATCLANLVKRQVFDWYFLGGLGLGVAIYFLCIINMYDLRKEKQLRAAEEE